MSYTFIACIVEQDEVGNRKKCIHSYSVLFQIGKAYAISSVAQKLAGIAQSLVLQNIYIATVDWYQASKAIKL